MKLKNIILTLATIAITSPVFTQQISFDFYGEPVRFHYAAQRTNFLSQPLSANAIKDFTHTLHASRYEPVIAALLEYKEKHKPDDWLYYQLVRKAAEVLSPKSVNYFQYTLVKWFLLKESGYDALITASADKILFYIRTDEQIYNIPSRIENGKQYVCLNYHDYGTIDFDLESFSTVSLSLREDATSFSYKIKQLPGFRSENYIEKQLEFKYYQSAYHFKIKVNPEVSAIFRNYPVVDYESYFNIPLSNATYASLIPALRQNVSGMSTKNGVDYLMRFTRYAFLFQPDSEVFGAEKRLSPEQTLLTDQSDCDDRAALFFYLVKEIYNIPMIVLAYPKHVTIAVKLDKPVGKHINYNGSAYSICEPTPQQSDLGIGQQLPELVNEKYSIAYAYNPSR